MGAFAESCSVGSSVTGIDGIDVTRVGRLVGCAVKGAGIGPSVTRPAAGLSVTSVDVGPPVGAAVDGASDGVGAQVVWGCVGCLEGYSMCGSVGF